MANRSDRWDRYEYDDRTYVSGGRGPGAPRERSVERVERTYRASEDDFVRDRRFRDDDIPRYRRDVPPPPPPQDEYGRRVVFEEREREREVLRDSPPPLRRPTTLLRRQSSLDTFDRRPPPKFYEREEYGAPARREDVYRREPPAFIDPPLPRTKALPPPRRYAEREYYDEIKVADPEYYGDEEFHSRLHQPERVREKEVVRVSGNRHRRGRSRESRSTYSRRSSRSRSSSFSSRSSSSSRGRVRHEYPKKGKTRIPARLVSTRALIDLGYPFIEEGNVVVVQRALGQENIDELLRLSREYKRTEVEIATFRGRDNATFVEERREREEIVFETPAPPPPQVQFVPAPPPPAPVIIEAAPPTTEVVNTTTTQVVRDVSPSRSVTSYATSRAPVVVEHREVSNEVPIGPLALVSRSRSRSRSGRDIRAEIRALEHELKHSHHHRGDVVRAERLSNGELVLYEEQVERVVEPRKGGVRIEKDKKGRMSISVPKYR